MQLLVHIDCFSVEPGCKQKVRGNLVWTLQDEVLPMNYYPKVRSATNSVHLVYCCITMRDVPAMALLVHSGSKNLPDRRPDSMKFWFEQLVECGIGSEDDEKMLSELAREKFKVLADFRYCATCMP